MSENMGREKIAPKNTYTWKLRDIVLTGILCVVGGGIFMGADWLYNVLFPTTASPVVGNVINGLWWIPAILVPYIIRRPGAAFIAEVVSALFEFMFGSPYSTGALISGLAQGLGAEIAFAIFAWRSYRLPVTLLAGALAGVGYSIQAWYQYQWNEYPAGIAIGCFVVTLLSGAILGGWIPKLIGDALNRAGVVRNFAIGRQARG